MKLPIPDINIQKEIVKEYNIIQDNIKNNESIIKNLEATAQAIYKEWFVDFNFPDEHGKPYKANGGAMVYNEILEKEMPVGWEVGSIGEYATVKSGYPFLSSMWENSGIPVIKIGSIQNKKIIFDEKNYVNGSLLSQAKLYIAYPYDVVIAMTGATIGKFAFLSSFHDKYLINQRVGIFDLGTDPLKKLPYLYISLEQDYIQSEIKNIGGSSAQENISNTQIQNIFLMQHTGTITNFNKLTSYFFQNIMLKQNKINIFLKIQNIILSKMSA